jgi:hypothetical protein
MNTRRYLLLLALLPVLFLAAAGTRADEPARYLSELPDLPLMAELTEVEGAGVVFDKPGGRIVELYAQGEVSADSVRAFYDSTLPQLGWRAAGGGVYSREGERLEIVVLSEAPPLAVRFTLRPE